MNRSTIIRNALALSLVATALTAGFTASAVQLTEDGEPRAVIVKPGKKPSAMGGVDRPHLRINFGVRTPLVPNIARDKLRKAGIESPWGELQRYLQRMTGADIPVVDAGELQEDGAAIVLEWVDRVPGASDKRTRTQAYRIIAEGNRIRIVAASEVGLYNGVYGFLEDHLGCRFYSVKLSRHRGGVSRYQGPDCEVVPHKPTLAVERIDDLQEPAIANRGLIYQMGQYPLVLKNRAVGFAASGISAGVVPNHNMYFWISPHDQKRDRKSVV